MVFLVRVLDVFDLEILLCGDVRICDLGLFRGLNCVGFVRVFGSICFIIRVFDECDFL